MCRGTNRFLRRNMYIEQAAYAQSKLCLLMFSLTLDRHLKGVQSNIQCMALHPGIVNTQLFDGTLVKLLTPWVLSIFCKVTITDYSRSTLALNVVTTAVEFVHRVRSKVLPRSRIVASTKKRKMPVAPIFPTVDVLRI